MSEHIRRGLQHMRDRYGAMRREKDGPVYREPQGTVRDRVVSACRDDHSLWVEIGGWELSPRKARELAECLTRAADALEKRRAA